MALFIMFCFCSFSRHMYIFLSLLRQEVVIEGQDKVFKDVIEPLENVSVTMIPTSKQDIRDLGSPQEVVHNHNVKLVGSIWSFFFLFLLEFIAYSLSTNIDTIF